MTQRGLLEGRDLPAALALAQAAEPPKKLAKAKGVPQLLSDFLKVNDPRKMTSL